MLSQSSSPTCICWMLTHGSSLFHCITSAKLLIRRQLLPHRSNIVSMHCGQSVLQGGEYHEERDCCFSLRLRARARTHIHTKYLSVPKVQLLIERVASLNKLAFKKWVDHLSLLVCDVDSLRNNYLVNKYYSNAPGWDVETHDSKQARFQCFTIVSGQSCLCRFAYIFGAGYASEITM